MKINIIGLHKALVLEALYDGAFYLAAKFDAQPAIRERAMSGEGTPVIKRMLANQFIKEKTQSSDYPKYQFQTIDLGAGPRELAIDLSGYEMDVSQYNELHGEGAAQKIISNLYGEVPVELEQSHVEGEEKNIFYAAIQDNANWLQPILPEIFQPRTKRDKKAENFAADLDKIFKHNQVQEKYEEKPALTIYLTWIKMLDPRVDQQTKESLCEALSQEYINFQSDQAHKISIGGTLSYLPSIITAPILLYSPRKILSAYYQYQRQYGEYSQELCDANFETTLKFLVNNDLFPKQATTIFLKKLTEMLKQRRPHEDDTDYLLHQAMASWEKNSLSTRVSEYFDIELQAEHDKFKEKLNRTLDNPGTKLILRSEFGALVFNRLLIACQYHAETVNPIVVHFTRDKDIQALAGVYTSHGLNAVAMFKRHLVQLAKATNEAGHDQFSSLFFSKCLDYLKDNKETSIAPEIATFLSAEYYAKHTYAFTTIRKEMLTIWIEHQPEQLSVIVKTVLQEPKDYHQTPIATFFSDLHYAEMPTCFYDKLATLLSDGLTPGEFISVYTAAPEEIQCKLLSALLINENTALTNLKNLSAVYETGEYSELFPRKLSNQLKKINPRLYQQAETEKLFVEEEVTDNLESDLRLLQKILANESPSHDERHDRRSEINKLNNLHAALREDAKTGACTLIMKMFNCIPQKHWPDLFVHFSTPIVHWSFPYDEERLDRFHPERETRPAQRTNTWLAHQPWWEDILYGSLVAILTHLNTDLRSGVAHWALSALEEAFTKSSTHFPGMVDEILKKFFLDNAPNSIKIFTAIHDKFNDKYHAPEYFSKQGIYSQVASWLPEDTQPRATILAKLLRVDKGFEPALRSPFVRSKQEVTQTMLELVNTRTENFANLLDNLSGNITSILFKSLNQFDEKGFLTLLQTTFTDIGKASLPLPFYMHYVVMLLSYSNSANIDIFKIIDADPNKDALIEAFGDIEAWKKSGIHSYPYEIIFRVVFYYQRDQLRKVIFDHIERNIAKDDSFSLCECIRADQKVSIVLMTLSQPEEEMLINYLTAKMPGALSYSITKIKVMAGFIPNFDQLFLKLMAEALKDRDDLTRSDKECLDSLVSVYGFSHINTICLNAKLTNCSAYLVEQFSKFPEILRQMDEAIDLYSQFFDEYQYKVDHNTLWHFYDNLRSTIREAAIESNLMTLDINIAEVCAKSEVAPELVALMPPLRIQSSVASLMAGSWERSGLMTSPSLSTNGSTVMASQHI